MSESIRKMTFYQLWDAALSESEDPNMATVVEWLKHVGWETLFPGHCFRCHGFEDGPCEAPEGHGAFACPGCVKED